MDEEEHCENTASLCNVNQANPVVVTTSTTIHRVPHKFGVDFKSSIMHNHHAAANPSNGAKKPVNSSPILSSLSTDHAQSKMRPFGGKDPKSQKTLDKYFSFGVKRPFVAPRKSLPIHPNAMEEGGKGNEDFVILIDDDFDAMASQLAPVQNYPKDVEKHQSDSPIIILDDEPAFSNLKEDVIEISAPLDMECVTKEPICPSPLLVGTDCEPLNDALTPIPIAQAPFRLLRFLDFGVEIGDPSLNLVNALVSDRVGKEPESLGDLSSQSQLDYWRRQDQIPLAATTDLIELFQFFCRFSGLLCYIWEQRDSPNHDIHELASWILGPSLPIKDISRLEKMQQQKLKALNESIEDPANHVPDDELFKESMALKRERIISVHQDLKDFIYFFQPEYQYVDEAGDPFDSSENLFALFSGLFYESSLPKLDDPDPLVMHFFLPLLELMRQNECRDKKKSDYMKLVVDKHTWPSVMRYFLSESIGIYNEADEENDDEDNGPVAASVGNDANLEPVLEKDDPLYQEEEEKENETRTESKKSDKAAANDKWDDDGYDWAAAELALFWRDFDYDQIPPIIRIKTLSWMVSKVMASKSFSCAYGSVMTRLNAEKDCPFIASAVMKELRRVEVIGTTKFSLTLYELQNIPGIVGHNRKSDLWFQFESYEEILPLFNLVNSSSSVFNGNDRQILNHLSLALDARKKSMSEASGEVAEKSLVQDNLGEQKTIENAPNDSQERTYSYFVAPQCDSKILAFSVKDLYFHCLQFRLINGNVSCMRSIVCKALIRIEYLINKHSPRGYEEFENPVSFAYLLCDVISSWTLGSIGAMAQF